MIRCQTILPAPAQCLRFLSVFLPFAYTLISTVPAAGTEEPHYTQFDIVEYKNVFKHKPPGTVAFLPRLGSEQYYNRVNEFHILAGSGFYKLPSKGRYFFEVNKNMGEDQKSFLAIAVYTIYRPGESPKYPVFFNRESSENWVSQNYDDMSARDIPPEAHGHLMETFDTLWRKHADPADLKTVDGFMKKRWHAWPAKDEEGSWDFKEELAKGEGVKREPNFQKLLRACKVSGDNYEVSLTVILIRFETSQSEESEKSLLFYFNGDNALGAYMHLRSPSLFDFSRDYYFVFAP